MGAQVCNLSGTARAMPAVRGLLAAQRGAINIGVLLDELTAVEQLGALLLAAVKKHQTSDGRVDTRDVAADVIAAMMPRTSNALADLVDNATAVTALARLLTEAFDRAIQGGQGLNINAAAAHVLRTMRGTPR